MKNHSFFLFSLNLWHMPISCWLATKVLCYVWSFLVNWIRHWRQNICIEWPWTSLCLPHYITLIQIKLHTHTYTHTVLILYIGNRKNVKNVSYDFPYEGAYTKTSLSLWMFPLLRQILNIVIVNTRQTSFQMEYEPKSSIPGNQTLFQKRT